MFDVGVIVSVLGDVVDLLFVVAIRLQLKIVISVVVLSVQVNYLEVGTWRLEVKSQLWQRVHLPPFPKSGGFVIRFHESYLLN